MDRMQTLLTESKAAPQTAIDGLSELVEEFEFHAAHYNLGSLLRNRDNARAARHLEQAVQASNKNYQHAQLTISHWCW